MTDTTTPLRKKRATKAEMEERRRNKWAGGRPGNFGSLLPGLVQERDRMFRDRVNSIATAPPTRVCGASVDPHKHPYTATELAPYQGRPGAMDAFSLPSVNDLGQRVWPKRNPS